MKKYKLNPVALRGTTIDLDNWAFNSIIDKRLKTNVKGIFIHEYWHPQFQFLYGVIKSSFLI